MYSPAFNMTEIYGEVMIMKIHDAVLAGDLESVARLVAESPRRIDLRENGKSYTTPLLLALAHSKFEIVHWLVEHGVDVNKTKSARYSDYTFEQHDSPLEVAVKIDRPDLVALFLKHGAVLPRTILKFAASWGRTAIIRTLIDAGAPLNQKIAFTAPLHEAIDSKHLEIA